MENLIGGKLLDASNNAILEVRNPATGELIDTVPNSLEKDIDNAVKHAKESYKNWANKPLYERAEILEKFVDLVEENKENLSKLLSDETGKPIKEARADITNIKYFVDRYIEKAKYEYGNIMSAGTKPGQEKTIKITTQEPLGIIGCIIPFNSSLNIFAQKIPPALIMGNSVIVKTSRYNPLTLHRYCEILKEAGVPDGVINCVSEDADIVGNSLSKHADVSLISVTVPSNSMIECGGNNAFILDKDGDIDLAVEGLVCERLYNAGQTYCSSKRFLIHKELKDEFIQKTINTISNIKVGMPNKEDTDIGCLINEQAAIKVEEQIKRTISEGANILIGGRRKNAFFEPTILDNVTKEMNIMKDMEILGPVIPICTFDNINQAIEISNQSAALSSCIFTKDMNKAFKIASQLEASSVIINGSSFYHSIEMPFSGWEHSIISDEAIASILKEMSKTKTIVLKNILK